MIAIAYHVRRVAVSLIAVSLTGLAAAQYIGPSTVPVYSTVADILKNPVDDGKVMLVGFIVKKVGSDKYIFSDGAAEIRVEIDAKYFPSTPISEKTKVRIRGEIEKDFLQSPEVDVDHLEILSAP